MPLEVTSPAARVPLQGATLLSFLDNAIEQLIYEDGVHSISPGDRANALAELLGQQHFAPRSLPELELLHTAWMHAGQHALAAQAVQEHRAAVLHDMDDAERLQAQAALALDEAQSLVLVDAGAAREALSRALISMRQLEGEALAGPYHNFLSLVASCEAYAIADAAIDELAPRLDPDGEQSFGEMLQPWLVKAGFAVTRGDGAAASGHAYAAIDRMAQLRKGDEHPDFNDWTTLGDTLLDSVPGAIAHWARVSAAHLQRTDAPAASAPVRMDRAIYTARLQALACDRLGQREQAIAFGRKARYELSQHEGDEFVAVWMQWLDAADLLDELAPVALESAFHSRPAALQAACTIALQRLESDPAHRAEWALILAWSIIDRDCRERVIAPPQPAKYYFDLVLSERPDDTVVDLMRGLQLARSRQKWAQALPLLERGIQGNPWLASSEAVLMLWAARLQLHGDAALEMPFVPSPSGQWSYGVGVTLGDDDELKSYLGGARHLPADDKRQPLALRYYEEGLRHFEQFWQTGEGGFKDADIHTYSMLCNNLAIRLRRKEDYARAVELHRKGLASSPFSEHHDGILWCAIMPDDYPAIVSAAEQLWHFAQEQGYGRHDPCSYFNWAAEALYHLDRDAEISIWLERLDLWWQENGDPDDAEQLAQYLECLLIMLDFFGLTHAELVIPRLPALQAQVQPLRRLVLQRRMGTVLMVCDRMQEALPFLQTAVAMAPDSDEKFDAEKAPGDLQRCQEALAALTAPAGSGKPWWKLW